MEKRHKGGGILLIVLIALCLLNTALYLTGNININSIIPMTVATGSMSPEINKGDAVIVYKNDFEDIAVDDVITYTKISEIVTHRVVEVNSEGVITKGDSNNYNDYLVTSNMYIGKIVKVLPNMGEIVNVCNSTSFLICLGVVFSVVWMILFFRTNLPKRDKLNCVMMCLMFFCICTYNVTETQAKYVVKQNEYFLVAASGYCFDSNYLTESGAVYRLSGWDGETYTIALEVNNKQNELLFNSDMDIEYGLIVNKRTGSAYFTDYDIEVNTSATIYPSENDFQWSSEWSQSNSIYKGPYLLVGNDRNYEYEKFNIRIVRDDYYELEAGTKIAFDVYLFNNSNLQYYKEMSGSFVLQVPETLDFFGETELTQDAESGVVTLTVKTVAIEDGDTQKSVLIEWDTDKVVINEFDSIPYDIIINDASNYNKEEGWIRIALEGRSSIEVQFFKVDKTEIIEDDAIKVTIEED